MEKILSLITAFFITITSSLGFVSKNDQQNLNILVTPTPVLAATIYPSTIPPTIFPSSTIIPSEKPVKMATHTPKLTPTKSLELIDQCNKVSKQKKYFEGVSCYYDIVQENSKKYPNGGPALNNINLLQQRISEFKSLDDILNNACIKITPQVFTACTNSIEKNVERFATQIKTNFNSELNTCLSKISEGDNSMKDKVREYFWKSKMKDNIDKIYTFCSENGSNLDKYNF